MTRWQRKFNIRVILLYTIMLVVGILLLGGWYWFCSYEDVLEGIRALGGVVLLLLYIVGMNNLFRWHLKEYKRQLLFEEEERMYHELNDAIEKYKDS